MTPDGPITDPAAARSLFAPLAREPGEIAALAFLDAEWRILALRHVAGAKDWTRLPVRTVARDALAHDASAVILAHNHPSGDPRPSAADIGYTRLLARALDLLGVRLVDHLVVAAGGITSMRATIAY